MQHAFEVFGTKGALAFTQERCNELHFYATADRRGRYLEAIAGRRAEPFNFRAGLRIQTLVEAIHDSSRAVAWRDMS